VRETYDVVVVGLGALGSATAWQLSRRGVSVLGLEQFGLGHDRGASHDSSRILRHSYHTSGYVRLTVEAYDDWADLEAAAGETFVTVTGGLDLFPPGGTIAPHDYTSSLDAVGIGYELLDVDAVSERWPQLRLDAGTVALYQARTAVVPAARGTAAMQRLAAAGGARLLPDTPATALHPVAGGMEVGAGGTTYSCGSVVLCADAWTRGMLVPLGVDLPLAVTEEQLTYFAPGQPEDFAPGRFPVWVWMDDPTFYGFPTYGEHTIKAAQDVGGPVVTAQDRSGQPDAQMRDRLASFMSRRFPGSGPPLRSRRCLYTLTPDRDFVLSRVPGIEQVVVGLGTGHGFKFAPTFGRRLVDLALGAPVGPELEPFRLDRPALTDPAYAPNWIV